MTMHVIGAGVGRTGTYSLKLALNRLGVGPCHHMEEVLHHLPAQVPLWSAALDGAPSWSAIYDGYRSAVDWPTASFYRELHAAFPDARFILTVRSAESWAASFGSTIQTLLARRADAPDAMQAWLTMAQRVIARAGFDEGLNDAKLQRAFEAHNDAVQSAIPSDQLLVFSVKEGWSPLCAFLGVDVPDEPFPRSNDRAEFWDRISGRS